MSDNQTTQNAAYTETFYSPLDFHLYNRKEAERTGESRHCDPDDPRYKITHADAISRFGDDIRRMMRRERGKLDPDVVIEGGVAYMALTAKLAAPLTDMEIAQLKVILNDEWSCGFDAFNGSGIDVGKGWQLLFMTWSLDKKQYFIDTQAEFDARMWWQRVEASVESSVEKLYSPLEFYRHNLRQEKWDGECGTFGFYDDSYRIQHADALAHMGAIGNALRLERNHLDSVRGLAAYVPDALRGKVGAVFPSIELFQAGLYFEATVKVSATLTGDETATLKDWWRGQLLGDFGEGLEGRDIDIGGGNTLNVALWPSDEDKFFIDTEREFRRRLGLDEPEAPAVSKHGEQARDGQGGYTSVLKAIRRGKDGQRAREAQGGDRRQTSKQQRQTPKQQRKRGHGDVEH